MPVNADSDQCLQVAVSDGETSAISPQASKLNFTVRNQADNKLSELDESYRAPIEVCEKLNTAFSGQVIYCERFSRTQAWLDQLFTLSGVKRKFKLRPIEALVPEIALNAWVECKRRLLELLQLDSNNAYVDATVSGGILEHLAMGESLPIYPRELSEWCKGFSLKSEQAQSQVA